MQAVHAKLLHYQDSATVCESSPVLLTLAFVHAVVHISIQDAVVHSVQWFADTVTPHTGNCTHFFPKQRKQQ